MVRKRGQENGIGIWEVDGNGELFERIEAAFDAFRRDQEFVDPDTVSLSDAYVVGSYGDGKAVAGRSDLDVVLSISYLGDLRSNEFSRFLRHACGAVVTAEVADGLPGIEEVDVLAYPMLEVTRHMREMGTHEPVETYYSLNDGERRHYFP